MIDKLLKDMDGNSWEELCQKCYKYRYNTSNYREVPAKSKGDAGIEGFNDLGIVLQCYFPERDYDDKSYYEHIRDKMTTDIGKMLKPNYKEVLKSLGVPIIKKWHFLIPNYRDKDILIHAENKANEVRNIIKANPDLYDYIDQDFKIIVQDAENLSYEIYHLFLANAFNKKINFSLEELNVNWEDCPSEKVQAITSKIRATFKNELHVQKIVQFYATAYLKGLELMNKLSESYKELYASLQIMINSYKKRAEQKTALNADASHNADLFMDILNSFRSELKSEFSHIDDASIDEVCYDLIGTWLADCSLWFVTE